MKKILFTIVAASLLLTACEKEECETHDEVTAIVQPKEIEFNSFELLDYNETNTYGNYWDSSTNLPDLLLKVYIGDVLVFTSEIQVSASPNTLYSLNTPTQGALPATIVEGELATILIEDHDGGDAYEEVGRTTVRINNFYESDNAASFEEFILYLNNGVQLKTSGTFLY